MAASADSAVAVAYPVEIFYSYSHKDEALRAQLHEHLASLRREGVAVYWDDRKIEPGDEWKREIDQHLNTADVILLLISASFINSDYCYAVEMQRAMQRYEAGEAHVVPILVEPCDWKKLPFEKLQVLPEGAKPVTKWDNRAEACANAAEGIRKIVEKVRLRPRVTAPALALAAKPQKERVLPAIWNVPHNRNRNFAGRETVLARLHEALAAGGAAALTQAITGLGGVGKTQTAIEFAYRYSDDYRLVWWIRSEEPARLASDYAALARPLGLKEEQELNVTVQAVRAELARRGRWLLVFDNANEAAEVRDYLPQAGQGHVLITSRSSDWLEVAEPLAITTWQRDESVAFLLKRTGQGVDALAEKIPLLAKEARSGAPPREKVVEGAKSLPQALEARTRFQRLNGTSETRALPEPSASLSLSAASETVPFAADLARTESANLLAEALGDLPLALEQAAANIVAGSGSIADYLRMLREHTREVLRRGKVPAGYHATVATTWEISFREVEKESEAAGQLMNLCAFLAPDDIGREMLWGGASFLPQPLAAAVADDLQWDDAVGALRKYSLVEVQDGAISVHRLVQAVVRDRLDEAGRKKWAEAAVGVVDAAFPYKVDDVKTWAPSFRLLPHALASTERAEELQVALKTCSRLLNEVGLYLSGRAEFSAAKSVHERSVRIDEAVYGADHPDVAIDLSNLGNVLREQGDLAGARACYERALKIGEAAYGKDHPQVAIYANNLGSVLRDQGDLVGARGCYERALRIDESAYGLDHPEVAADVNNLGGVLRDQGDLAGARACYGRSLRIDEAAYGPDHPTVAVRVNNLGNVLRDQGDFPGARACYQRALKISELAYGADHPTVAIRVNNLGNVLRDLRDLAGARKCLERAVRIFERSLGMDHPKTRLARRNLENLG
jgi:tetratricopeptide (TPR) repeat protein